MSEQKDRQKRTFAVLVDNEPGVLARVIGLFSGRGYNIESLTVTEVDVEEHLSRITIVTSGTSQVLDQIYAQLDRLVPVHRVSDITAAGPTLPTARATSRQMSVGSDTSRSHTASMPSSVA